MSAEHGIERHGQFSNIIHFFEALPKLGIIGSGDFRFETVSRDQGGVEHQPLFRA